MVVQFLFHNYLRLRLWGVIKNTLFSKPTRNHIPQTISANVPHKQATGTTTIQHQHIYTNEEGSSKEGKFNTFIKYFSLVTFSVIVGVDLISESRSNKVSSVYVAIIEKKRDIEVVGRDEEVAIMRKAFRSSHATTWLITGPGGCGKSDLVRHAMCGHPFSLYLNVREFVGKEINATVVVERFNDVIGLPNKGLFASILAWTGRSSEPNASSQFADSLSILAEALTLIHHPDQMDPFMRFFIKCKSYGREINTLPEPGINTPCPVVVMDEGQVLASPMLSATAGGVGTLLMAALAAVTSVDMGLAHFVIVSNESTQLRQLLKETSTLNSVWVREMSVSDISKQDAHKYVLDLLNKNKFGVSRLEIMRIADLIVENFGGRIGDLSTIVSIHLLEGIAIEEAIQSLWNIRYHDLAEVISAIPNNSETAAMKLVKKTMAQGTISHREAVKYVEYEVLQYLVHEGILHRYLVPNSTFPRVSDLPFYTIGSTFTQKILEDKFLDNVY